MKEKQPQKWNQSQSPFDSELVWSAQFGMDWWLKEHSGLIEKGSWSWLGDLLGSSCPGSPRKLLWGLGRTQGFDMYEGWGQPGFLQDGTGQIAQDCPPLVH